MISHRERLSMIYLSQWIKNTLELCAQNVQVKVWLKSHNRIFVFILVFCWTDMHSQMRFKKKVFRTTAGNKWANRNKITLSYWHIVIHNREILHPGHYPKLYILFFPNPYCQHSGVLNPYPRIFGTITERAFWKSVQIECQLGVVKWCNFKMAYAKMEGNMPRWIKIYATFRDRQQNMCKWCKLHHATQFFSGKRARSRSRVLDFSPGFTDKG